MHSSSRARGRLDPTVERIIWRDAHRGSSQTRPLTPWLAVERFAIDRIQDRLAVLQLMARLDDELAAPTRSTLLLQGDAFGRAYTPSASSICSVCWTACDVETCSGLLWRLEF